MGAFEDLDTDEPLAKRMERHAYDRLIMLSDGVFAIAITLAALEIRAPANWDRNPYTLAHAIVPTLASYAIAFAVISAYWMAHRRMIAKLVRVDALATVLNLIFLGLIALQPAAVRLLTDYGPTGLTGQIYYGQIVLIGVVQGLFWLYASTGGRLVDPALGWAARAFVLVNTILIPLLSAFIGVTAAQVRSAPVVLAMIGVLVVIGFGRRFIDRRFGF